MKKTRTRVEICISTLPTQYTTFYVSLWRRSYARNVRLYFLYRQYTNLFIFRFESQHCLRSTLHFMFLSDEGPTFKTLDFAFYIGSTPTFLYFDLYLNTAYATHYVCFTIRMNFMRIRTEYLVVIKSKSIVFHCKNWWDATDRVICKISFFALIISMILEWKFLFSNY